jgi:hypothetical protein
MLQSTPLQTSYPQYAGVGILGRPATMVGWDDDTRLCEDPTGNGIGFGKAVCQGYKSDKGATLGQLSGGAFVGISAASVATPLYATTPAGTTPRVVDTYYDTDNMPVCVHGDIWVAPTTTVASGNPVYFNSVTGDLGSASIPNAVAITNSRWESSLPNFGLPPSTGVNFNGLAIARLGASAQ